MTAPMADQSNEMVSRVARALMLADGYEPECWPYQAARYLKLARAAIEAMRTPTKAMIETGAANIAPWWSLAMHGSKSYGDTNKAAESAFNGMVDAALSHDEVKG